MRLFIFPSCFARPFKESGVREIFEAPFLRADIRAPRVFLGRVLTRRMLFRECARETRFARFPLRFLFFVLRFFAICLKVKRKIYLPARKMSFLCSLAVRISPPLQSADVNAAKRQFSLFCGVPQSFLLITLWISCGLRLPHPSPRVLPAGEPT